MRESGVAMGLDERTEGAFAERHNEPAAEPRRFDIRVKPSYVRLPRCRPATASVR
jgi:hypothetical protein